MAEIEDRVDVAGLTAEQQATADAVYKALMERMRAPAPAAAAGPSPANAANELNTLIQSQIGYNDADFAGLKARQETYAADKAAGKPVATLSPFRQAMLDSGATEPSRIAQVQSQIDAVEGQLNRSAEQFRETLTSPGQKNDYTLMRRKLGEMISTTPSSTAGAEYKEVSDRFTQTLTDAQKRDFLDVMNREIEQRTDILPRRHYLEVAKEVAASPQAKRIDVNAPPLVGPLQEGQTYEGGVSGAPAAPAAPPARPPEEKLTASAVRDAQGNKYITVNDPKAPAGSKPEVYKQDAATGQYTRVEVTGGGMNRGTGQGFITVGGQDIQVTQLNGTMDAGNVERMRARVNDAQPAAAPAAPAAPAAAAVKLGAEERLAYLKVAGFDGGKLDGSEPDRLQPALNAFAVKNGIDPKDTAKIDAALKAEMGTDKARKYIQDTMAQVDKTQDFKGDKGKVDKDQIKAMQWAMKGDSGMPLSLKDGKMDGWVGKETRATRDTYMAKPSVAPAAAVAAPAAPPVTPAPAAAPPEPATGTTRDAGRAVPASTSPDPNPNATVSKPAGQDVATVTIDTPPPAPVVQAAPAAAPVVMARPALQAHRPAAMDNYRTPLPAMATPPFSQITPVSYQGGQVERPSYYQTQAGHYTYNATNQLLNRALGSAAGMQYGGNSVGSQMGGAILEGVLRGAQQHNTVLTQDAYGAGGNMYLNPRGAFNGASGVYSEAYMQAQMVQQARINEARYGQPGIQSSMGVQNAIGIGAQALVDKVLPAASSNGWVIDKLFGR